MKNFGKLTATPQIIEIPGMIVREEEDGTVVREPPQKYNVLIFRDRHGVDICEAVKSAPHPFYIAVDDAGIIRSMVDDIEQSQISGLDIIGIDKNFGYTFGPGGTAYGMKWTGVGIVNPINVMTREEKRALMPNLSGRQIWLMAHSINITKAMVLAKIAEMEDRGLAATLEIELTEPPLRGYERASPAANDLAAMMEIPEDQFDSLWTWAATL